MITIDPGERVDKVVHRHWFILASELIGVLIIWALPIGLWYYATRFIEADGVNIAASLSALPSALIVFVFALWTLIMWMRIFASWMDYFLDEWIITDKRIIDVEQKGFFAREVSNFRMERIQDVTTEITGVIPTLLDYGDIHVQTAGESRVFLMKNVSRPQHLKELIQKNHDEALEREPSDRALG